MKVRLTPIIPYKCFYITQIRPDAIHNSYKTPLPSTYVKVQDLPASFDWGNVNGVSYLTHSLNQHVPQYCGSCWAHGALSSFSDRIKIARLGTGTDINLSIQYILNCATEEAGSCHGGYHTSVYEYIKEVSGFIPYDTCNPYLACSDESTDGFCKHIDTTCTPSNICKTCDTFAGMGGACTEIDYFPNATVAEYGMIEYDDDVVTNIMTEIFIRGPVAATINAEPIVHYKGGIYTDSSHSTSTNHIVSITGWGTEEETGIKYWIVRNSWGEYWGEMGFIRVEMGKNLLGLEGEVAWVTPASFTVHNFPCAENGDNCIAHHNEENGSIKFMTQFYQDPALHPTIVQKRFDQVASKAKLVPSLEVASEKRLRA